MPNGGESLTLQQIMDTIQALQEEVVVSRADQERIQDNLAMSRTTNEELRQLNEELHRDLQNQAREREEEDQEPATPPREFPMPFSQAIMDAVIPTTFIGPKVTFTGMKDPEAHLTAFHTQTMLVGGSDVVRCKLFMSTLVGTTMDWFISLPDGHVTSFPQLTKSFREQYIANRAPPSISYDLFAPVDLTPSCVSVYFASKNPSLPRSLPPVEYPENRETKGALAVVCTSRVKSVSRSMNTKLSLLDHCVFSLTLFTLINA